MGDHFLCDMRMFVDSIEIEIIELLYDYGGLAKTQPKLGEAIMRFYS